MKHSASACQTVGGEFIYFIELNQSPFQGRSVHLTVIFAPSSSEPLLWHPRSSPVYLNGEVLKS